MGDPGYEHQASVGVCAAGVTGANSLSRSQTGAPEGRLYGSRLLAKSGYTEVFGAKCLFVMVASILGVRGVLALKRLERRAPAALGREVVAGQ